MSSIRPVDSCRLNVRMRGIRSVLALSLLGVACSDDDTARLGSTQSAAEPGCDTDGGVVQPSVRIVSPAPGATVAGTVALRARATGPVKNIEFFDGAGKKLGTATLAGLDGTYNLDTRTIGNGPLVVVAKAWDVAAGQPASFEVSSTPLALTVANTTVAPPPPPATAGWAALDVLTIVNPKSFGAVGDGQADDQPALEAAIAALPAQGGVVFLPAAMRLRKRGLLYLKKHHVKFWSPNGQGELYQTISGQRRKQSILCDHTTGCGFFGVKFRSDAAARFDALEDNHISTIAATDTEIVGCDIAQAAAAGIFFYEATKRTFLEGNYVHHTWADTVHFTGGSRQAWAWDNIFRNEAPTNGDDGIACVTYNVGDPRCGDMEWWRNTHLGNGWGRGYTVVGGDHISIHHNFARNTAGAGILVASESSYSTPGSNDIQIRDNVVYRASTVIGHPGILISGANPNAGPLDKITLTNNLVVDTVTGTAFRSEGAVTNLINTGLSTNAALLPNPLPAVSASTRAKDTTIMKTRDTSFVAAANRAGLYRIHVRQNPAQAGQFQQRFEYVVAGAPAAVDGWTNGASATVLGTQTVGAEKFVAVLTSTALPLAAGLRAVPFEELRTRDNAGTLSALWAALNNP